MAVTTIPVVALKPTAGLQAYVVAPPAVRFTELPEQNVVGLDGVMETVGVALTVIANITGALVQPAIVPVTV